MKVYLRSLYKYHTAFRYRNKITAPFFFTFCVPLLVSVCLCRSDTVRYALDILAILMVVPKVQLVLADTVEVLDEARSPVSTVGQ